LLKGLGGQGYQVILASDGQEAIDLAKGFDGKIDLLLSDVILPKINGPALYKKLCRTTTESESPVHVGYTDNALAPPWRVGRSAISFKNRSPYRDHSPGAGSPGLLIFLSGDFKKPSILMTLYLLDRYVLCCILFGYK
jgi:hypothetical protein